MRTRFPTFPHIPQIGIELALAKGAPSSPSRALWGTIGGKIALNDASAHVQFPRNSPPAHACLVQGQKMLIPSIPLVSTNFLFAFCIRQGGKLDFWASESLLPFGRRLIGFFCW